MDEITEDKGSQLRVEAGLRRVATLAAHGAPVEKIFDAVDGEVGTIFGLVALALYVVDAGRRLVRPIIGTHGDQYLRGPWQDPLSFDTLPFVAEVASGRRPLREDGWSHSTTGSRNCCDVHDTTFICCPIIVGGRTWGLLFGHGRGHDRLPDRCEQRVAEFGDLIGAAASNGMQRDQLGEAAASQAALRRVATLVADGAEPETVFTAVASEAAASLGIGAVSLISFDRRTALFTKIFGTHGERAAVPDGGSWGLEDCPEGAAILRSGAPVRIDDWSSLPGPVAERHRASGFGQAIAAPIVLDGAIWGHMAAFAEAGEDLPPGSEIRLDDFTQLMASALANAHARAELRGLATAQGAALRRVAGLVAAQASPSTIFRAVASEAVHALRVSRADVGRRQQDGSIHLLGSAGGSAAATEFSAPGRYVAELVTRLGRTVRLDDWAGAPPEVAEAAASDGAGSVAGAPIVVDGDMWGVIVVLADVDLGDDVETRLSDFTHLVAGSIANVQARNDLVTSRARIVAAGDDSRRRIERNLHDGIQQRVISVGLSLRAVRTRFSLPAGLAAGLDDVARDLDGVVEEIHTFSQGLHPVLLSRSGLPAAIKALARRSPIPVALDIAVQRLPEPIETTVYYAISEAMANTTKHARARSLSVQVGCDGGVVRTTVGDDGCGGAVLGGGSGLIGLADRVEACGGRLTLESPPGRGTRLSIVLPVEPDPATYGLTDPDLR